MEEAVAACSTLPEFSRFPSIDHESSLSARTSSNRQGRRQVTGRGPSSRSFLSQRLRLNYVDWGNPDAPLLILIHGSRDHCRSWDWAAEALKDEWHVVAPDLRGHGDSAWSPEGRYDFTAYVYDLAQLMFELGGETATIVAHSLGAHIALRYAGIYPQAVRKLVAIEAVGAPPKIEAERNAPGLDRRFRRWIDEKRAMAGRLPRRYASIDEALERMKAESRGLSDEQIHHLTFHGIGRNEDGSWSWKFDNYLKVWLFPDVAREDAIFLWNRVRCPTLMLYGKKSWPSDLPRELARQVKGSRTVEFADAGHWLHHDQFDRFIEELRAFL